MYLDYTKIKFDSMGRPEVPDLLLQTMSGRSIGFLDNVLNLKLTIKFSEPSEISFELPAYNGGVPTPHYDDVVGYKVIYTENYGIYLITKPSISGDGVEEVKSVSGYSIEQELDYKTFFLEEGTFNFWNPADPDDTLMGRVMEIATGWKVGYISPTLIGRYRTFTEYDDYLLDFVYDTAPEKFRCVFVFDPYARTINVYDADEERPRVPIYLDFENLLESLDVDELSDELVTAMRPYGADELDIRDVNPIGTNWIYDLSYFIENGDIPAALASKWEQWQKDFLEMQPLYISLVGLRASATAQLLSEKATLTELNAELTDLTNQQSVTIQQLAIEFTDAGKQSQQELLDQINAQIAAKKEEIAAQEAKIEELDETINGEDDGSYVSRIQDIVNTLAIDKYFTAEEHSILSKYFIEQDLTEDTFVATGIDTSVSGETYNIQAGTMSITGAKITQIDLYDEFNKVTYSISGGKFFVTGSMSLIGDVIRGTVEIASDNSFVMSVYAGTITAGESKSPSGMITVSGTAGAVQSDISSVTENEITTLEGTQMSFSVSSASLFLTANVSDYQKYSVEMELYDYAASVLKEVSSPTYEFSVSSGNFLFADEFAPFRDSLKLGCGVYLRLDSKTVIRPLVIEFELDFEDHSNFSLIFSNRFKRHDSVNALKDMLETSYSSSRSFDSSKYIYNQTAGQASQVSDFMNGSLDAAVNAIIGASNQSVLINGSGINIGGDSDSQIRIVDRMIAFTDDNWQTAKMALGMFATPESGTYFGINAEVVGGKLIVGNNLVIENETDDGVMQFKVDSSGAWLNNSTFVLQKDNGGKIIIDPKYGIVAGTGNLFTVDGTTVSPSFIDEDGEITLDADGFPENSNFYLDIQDGNAYFRGSVSATAGDIGGWKIGNQRLYSGSGSTYVALNASDSEDALYAMWAGAENPANAPFSVRRNGDLVAENGTFGGTVSGADFTDRNGNSMMNSQYQFTADYLNINGLNVGNGNFVVSSDGNVSMRGSITLDAGSTINWANVSESNLTSNEAYQLANQANNKADSLSDDIDDLYYEIDGIYIPSYITRTGITATTIESPTIIAGEFYGDEYNLYPDENTDGGSFNLYGRDGSGSSGLWHALQITYTRAPEPVVNFSSPVNGYATWDFYESHFSGRTYFIGSVNFSQATVTGLDITGYLTFS